MFRVFHYEVFQLTKAGKLSCAAAKGEFIKCSYNLVNNLKIVELKEQEEKRLRIQAYQKYLDSLEMDEPLKIPREYSLFQEWLAEQAKVLFRQFLFVVDGASRCGKSQYLKMKLPGTTFVCNCRNATSPDLRDFEGPPFQHNILFDELSPAMVESHRDLFQAPKHPVGLGHSGTNMYAYKVLLWRVRLAATANDWFVKLDKLEPLDKKWVEENTMVLSVDEHMFTEQLLEGSSAAGSS